VLKQTNCKEFSSKSYLSKPTETGSFAWGVISRPSNKTRAAAIAEQVLLE
jgi:hypothetical protein